MSDAELSGWIADLLSNALGVRADDLSRDTPFADLGLSSRAQLELVAGLQDRLGHDIAPTLLWEHSTISDLARALGAVKRDASTRSGESLRGVPRPDDDATVPTSPIAVIGMACEFPGASGLTELWDLIGRAAHPDPATAARPDPSLPPVNRLRRPDTFDHRLFGISATEARWMDPRQGLALEVSWSALEHAGLAVDLLAGTRTGVFLGASAATAAVPPLDTVDTSMRFAGTGNSSSILANRISYVYDLRGPSVCVDTACSSSLTAVHLACRALAQGDCDLALAGGVNLFSDTDSTRVLDAAGMLSPSGACHTFEAVADGYLRAEGCGIVVLKPLALARRDGDRVLGVIRGTAAGQDGRSNGLTAPNVAAQRDVVGEALRRADVASAAVTYVECHGTGTPLGDPIEVKALGAVLQRDENEPPCHLGSVKANVGHAEAAAGIAGLIKVLLQGMHGSIAAQPLHGPLNDGLAMASHLKVATSPVPWHRPRLAGVSSFGFGGANAHLVLNADGTDEPDVDGLRASRQDHLLVLSAATEDGVRALARTVSRSVAERDLDLTDVAHTLTERRTRHPFRAAVVARPDSAERMLNAVAVDRPIRRVDAVTRDGGLVFAFGGQVPSVRGLGRGLFRAEEGYRRRMLHFDTVLTSVLGGSLVDVVYGAGQRRAGLASHTEWIQPALVAHHLAVAGLWRDWGAEPVACLGHSLGEISAAAQAGLLDHDEAVVAAAERGRIMAGLRGRAQMWSVRLAPTAVRAMDQGRGIVSVACENARNNTVVTVLDEHLSDAAAILDDHDVAHRVVNPHYGFHHPLVHEAGLVFAEWMSGRTNHAPTADLITTVDGTTWHAAGTTLVDDTHWHRHAVEPVRFSSALDELHRTRPDATVLEIGAGSQVMPLMVQQVPILRVCTTSTVAAHPVDQVLAAAGELIERGVELRKVETSGSLLGDFASYPFARQHAGDPGDGPAADDSREEANVTVLHDEVLACVAAMLGTSPQDVQEDQTFLDAGADSVMLIQLVQQLRSRLGVEVGVPDLFREINTPTLLVEHIAAIAPASALRPAAPTPVASADAPREAAELSEPARDRPASDRESDTSDMVRELLRTHEQVMNRVADLVESAHKSPSPAPPGPTDATPTAPAVRAADVRADVRAGQKRTPPNPTLTAQQRDFVRDLVARVAGRTPRSAEHAQDGMRHLADIRQAPAASEVLRPVRYPVVVRSASGSSLTDIDGNEYVDFTMGFGCHLFGNNPPFLREAQVRALDSQQTIGPQSELAASAARRFCRLTGHDRMTFCNTGSEAVMLAVRTARAITGRSTIVIFEGSYHGAGDGVLVTSAGTLRGESVPSVPGATEGVARDVVVLPYGAESSLEHIAELGDTVAAVLVEPVQSRRPGLQPREFCRRLRELTSGVGAALVFDEVITGFRVAPAGVQTSWAITPDLSVYGKAVAGGMPIGIVAGTSRFMDALDGGPWRLDGDEGYSPTVRTFFTGTFCKHPQVLAAMHAVLDAVEEHGAARLFDDLTARTTALRERLDRVLAECDVPVRVVHFGSLFRFEFNDHSPASLAVEAFYLGLLEKGVYIWEGRNCFLSTAHTDMDLDRLVQAVRDLCLELARVGLLTREETRPGASRQPVTADDAADGTALRSTIQQRELWFVQHATPEAASALVERVVVALRGPVDVERLRRSFASVLSSTVVFSTVFKRGGTLQVTRPDLAHNVLVTDMTSLSVAESQRAWSSLVEQDEQAGFDLAQGPLGRAAVVVFADEVRVLLSAHHAVIDGWALELVLADVAATYRGADPQPVVPFERFARWQDDYLKSPQRRADEQFWLRRHPRPWASPRLPHASIGSPDAPGPRQTLELGRSDADAVAQRARAAGVTPFAMALAAFGRALRRVGAQETFTVGVPVAQRLAPGLDRVIGNCSNVVPITLDRRAGETLSAEAVRVGEQFLEASPHSALPISLLRGEWSTGADGDGALLPFLFNVNRATEDFDFGGPACTVEPASRTVSMWTCFLDVTMAPGGWHVTLEHDAAEVSTKQGREILAAFADELRRPDQLNAPHPAGTPAARTVLDRFRTQALAFPARPAVAAGAETWTYGQLLDRATRLAQSLASHGVTSGDRVALALPKTDPGLLASLLAVWMLRGVAVMMDADWPSRRIAELVEASGADCLITGSEDQLSLAMSTPQHTWQQLIAQDGLGEAPPAGPAPCEWAYICFTSGSSGMPKAVAVSHANLAAVLDSWHRAYGLDRFSRRLQTAGTAFDVFVADVACTLGTGAALVLLSKTEAADPARLRAKLDTHEVDYVEMVPALARRLRDHLVARGERLRTVRTFCVGGAAFSGAEMDGLRAVLPEDAEVTNSYGLTETTIDTTFMRLRADEPASRLSSLASPLGVALPGLGATAVDNALEPLSSGTGQLLVSGPGVTAGYLGDPRRTAEVFLPDPLGACGPGSRAFATGDLVRVSPHGFDLVGRVDRQVELRGLRIHPAEVEQKVRALPGVADAVVVHRPSAGGGELVAAVVLESGAQLETDDIVNTLSASLPSSMVPREVVLLERLPHNSSGKVDHVALALELGVGPSRLPDTRADGAGAAPGDDPNGEEPLVGEVLNVWREVLGHSAMTPEDQLLSVGGNSLHALEILGRLEDRFGTSLPVEVMLRNPSPRELARLLDARGGPEPQGSATVGSVVGDPWGVTSAQERFWMLQQADRHSSAYNLTVAADVTGPVSDEAVEEALNDLVEAFPLLLDTFAMSSSGTVQRTRDGALPVLTHVDVRGLDVAHEEHTRELVEQQDAMPFDLGTGPMLRVLAVRTTDDRMTLAFTLHHILCDPASVDVLSQHFRESLKRGAAGGSRADRGELGARTSDEAYEAFRDAERRTRVGGGWDRDLAYWRDLLAEDGHGTSLAATGNAHLSDSEALTVDAIVPRPDAERLAAVAAESGATTFAAVIAVSAAVLAERTGEERVVIGTQVDTRSPTGELDDAVAPALNTLPVVIGVGAEASWPERLDAASRGTAAMLAHRLVPFQEIVRTTQPKRTRDRHPVFQIMVQFVPRSPDPVDVGALQWHARSLHSRHPKFELAIDVIDEADGLRVKLLLDGSRFDPADGEELMRSWMAHLASLVNGDDPVRGDERALVAAAHEAFDEHASTSPDLVALRWGDRSLTYGQLDAWVGAVACDLMRSGVSFGDRIAIMAPQGDPAVVAAMLAASRAGVAWIPIDAAMPAARVRVMLAAADVRIVAGTAAAVEGEDWGRPALVLDPDEPHEEPHAHASPRARAVNPALPVYVLFTSGSTGVPKGVEVGHGALVSRLAWQQTVFPLVPGDSVVMTFSHAFDAGVWQVFGPLSRGATVVALSRAEASDPTVLVERLLEHRTPVLKTVPSMLEQVLDVPATARLGKVLDAIACGGEELPAHVHSRCVALLPTVTLRNMYGPTETTINATHWTGNEVVGATPIGFAVDDATVDLVDDNLRTVSRGQVVVGGTGLANGYVGDPRATAERFVPDPAGHTRGGRLYLTGDEAKRDDTGALVFIGRLDRQVQVRGHRVELEDVERTARATLGPGVIAAVMQGDDIVLVLDGSRWDLPWQEARDRLALELPPHCLPARSFVLEAVPRLVSGKTDMDAVLAQVRPTLGLSGADPWSPPDASEPTLERVRAVWAYLLGRTDVPDDRDFFECGGHSLLAIRLVTLLNQVFDTSLVLADFFEATTVSEQAAMLDATRSPTGPRHAGPPAAPTSLPAARRRSVP